MPIARVVSRRIVRRRLSLYLLSQNRKSLAGDAADLPSNVDVVTVALSLDFTAMSSRFDREYTAFDVDWLASTMTDRRTGGHDL